MNSATINEQIGSRIAEYRIKRGLSQAQIADFLGLPQPNVSRWERGRTAPSYSTLYEIASALGVSVHDLIPGSSGEVVRHDN